MLRFIALVWNPTSQTQSSESNRLCQLLASTGGYWHRSLSTDGLVVFHTGIGLRPLEVQPFRNHQGLVLGTLFKRGDEPASAPAAIGEAESKQILDTNGRFLIHAYWGRYVAILFEASTCTTRVIRSPFGALNCFEAHSNGVRIFFSDVRDYAALCSEPLFINWPFIATLLAYPRHAMGSSSRGLDRVTQIQPGECVVYTLSGASRKELLWNPFAIALSDPIEDFSAATTSIHNATHSCVWSWAACYPRIVHLLSGGLDSSIVLGCLSTAPSKPRITCVTHFDESCITGDERSYARSSARKANCHLVEIDERQSQVDLLSILRIAKHPVPWSYILYVRHSARESELARSTDSSAIFSGAGGDQVFFYGPAVLAAADYLRQHGAVNGFIRYALSVARRNRLSLWSVLATALRDRLTLPRYDAVKYNETPNRLITQEAVATADASSDIRHYWTSYAHGVPHGKLFHVFMTDYTQDLQDPLGAHDQPERVHPLVSQPIVEACLRIPTYLLTKDGLNRAAARIAFANDLSPTVATRLSKGFIDSQNASLLQRNLKAVRELLLDGILVAERLIDRRKLELLLTAEQVQLSPDTGEALCEHLSYEAWLRTWMVSIRRPQYTPSHRTAAIVDLAP